MFLLSPQVFLLLADSMKAMIVVPEIRRISADHEVT
jgi:hypothetical protein